MVLTLVIHFLGLRLLNLKDINNQTVASRSFWNYWTSRQDRMAILGEIFAYFPLIFRRFSAIGTPSAVFPPTCLRIMDYAYFRLFLPIFCLFSAYFRLFFTYFLLIFHLKWYPILIINSSILPIFRFSAHMFTDSAYFPPKIPPIFRRSCHAGMGDIGLDFKNST